MNRHVLAWALGCLTLTAGAGRSDNWMQWRGPNNDGICNERNLPTKWSESSNLAWKFALPGEGGSTPVVCDKHIFLTVQKSAVGKVGNKGPKGPAGNLLLLCVGTDGKEKWQRDLGPGIDWARGDEGNGASASLSSDGKSVYAFVGNGTFAAFTFAGKEVWRFDAQERYGKFEIAFGVTSTPVLYQGRLYFQLIHDGGGLVVCVDAKDGKEVWKIERESDGTNENKHSYASAFLWKKGDDAYLVCHGNDYTTAHSLSDGKEIWRIADLNPRNKRYHPTLRFVASPVCTPDLIVVPTAKDGPVVGLKPDARGKVTKGSKFEQWRIPTGTPDVPCPLVADGLVYLAGENGSLTCLDAKTAKVYYGPQKTHGHRHRASPVLADGKLYLTARDGVTTVAKAGKEFEILATNKLPDQIAASPAISEGRIYLRGFKYLWAIGK